MAKAREPEATVVDDPTSPAKGSTQTTTTAPVSGGASRSRPAAAKAPTKGNSSNASNRPVDPGEKSVKEATAPAEAGTSPGDGSPESGENMTFVEQQRRLLLAERDNYMRQADELKAEADALAFEHEPGDVQFDEEGGEGGTANVDRELDLHLSSQARLAIEEIDAALAKLETGAYGRCEHCGNPIPEARLEALPHARLCVACKSGGLSSRR
jgi:DnaK suppressor protein